MADDVAEIEAPPAAPDPGDKQPLVPPRSSDDRPQQKDEAPNDRKVQQADASPAPLPRWPFALVGLVVAIFAAGVLHIIFRPQPDVRTDDAYVMVHYATIAPRISGQIATVSVDDNDTVKAGQVLATLDPRDHQTGVASAEAALARDKAQLGEVSANVARQPSIIEEQR